MGGGGLGLSGPTIQEEVPGVSTDLDKPALLGMLEEARHDWEHRERYRRQRRKARNYYRGLHWNHVIEDPDNPGQYITEKELIERQQRVAWVMNHIQALVRNLKGQFRQNRSARAVVPTQEADPEMIDQVNLGLRAVRRYNRMRVIEPDGFEEHILSGASAYYVDINYDPTLRRNEVSVEVVDQARLFYNLDIRDRRIRGLRRVGMLHDLTWQDLVSTYATRADGTLDRGLAEQLKESYGDHSRFQWDIFARYGFGRVDSLDFYNTWDTGFHRVVELWRYEHRVRHYLHDLATGEYERGQMSEAELGQENYQREIAGLPELRRYETIEPAWYQYHLTPWGDLLYHSETPYWHGSHPFVLGLSVLLDGETWGLIENVIDPQRWLNRITSMLDFSLASSAKGVLLVAEEQIPDDMDITQFASEWSRANGVVRYKLKPGADVPQQIASNSIPAGAFEMLGALKQWIEETSGVTGPMQGFRPDSGTPASLYRQQILQAATTNLDYFETYLETLHETDKKALQCMLQAFAERRTLHDPNAQTHAVYDPETVRSIDWDVAMADVADTATYRAAFEQDLQQFLFSGFLDFGTFLEMSSHPKAQQLAQLLQRRRPDLLELDAHQMGDAASSLLPAAQGAAAQSDTVLT